MATLDDAVLLGLAERFANAVTKRDLDAMRALFAPDAVFWTNISQTEIDLETRLGRIELEFEIFDAFAFEEMRVDAFAQGFVLRAQARGSIRGGERFDFPLCVVAEARDGLLVRFEEYVDPTPVLPIVAALEAAEGSSESSLG